MNEMLHPQVKRRFLLSLATVLAAASIASCSVRIDNRGHMPAAEQIEAIKPGKQTREQIRDLFGSPSTTAGFGDEVWFYIGKRTKTLAFFSPDVLEQKVLAIRFDKKGVVAQIRTYDAEDAREVALVDRETPTKGKELGFMQQLVGNIGRFSSGPQGE